MGQVYSMLDCQVFCNDSKSCFLHCLHYCLPCAREGARSCLVGGPLAQQVQHTVCWVVCITCFNGFHGLVVHTQKDAKVPPFCIQLVVESFNDGCSQRRDRQEAALYGVFIKHTAVLSQTHVWHQLVLEVSEEE